MISYRLRRQANRKNLFWGMQRDDFSAPELEAHDAPRMEIDCSRHYGGMLEAAR
jgi:hypothetical protein